MSKHTKGRWVSADYGDYKDYDGKCRVILGENGDIRTAVVLGFDTEENKANARLIAAAPELLDALKDALCALECCGKDYPAASKARSAIAKATGAA